MFKVNNKTPERRHEVVLVFLLALKVIFSRNTKKYLILPVCLTR